LAACVPQKSGICRLGWFPERLDSFNGLLVLFGFSQAKRQQKANKDHKAAFCIWYDTQKTSIDALNPLLLYVDKKRRSGVIILFIIYSLPIIRFS